MDFIEVLDQVADLLRQRGRLTYRTIKLQFHLDDEHLDALKDELIKGQRLATDEDGEVLVWTEGTEVIPAPMSASNVSSDKDQKSSPISYTPQHLTEKILTSRSTLEGERKQVTVMFADIKDSTELIRDLDPEAAQQLLDPAIHIMMDAMHRFEGTVNQVLGDGIMALFGAPIAHEDHAARACYAALAMHTAMQPYADQVRRAHGIEIRIRVGLNSGEVVVRNIGNDLHMDYSAVGLTVHLAARMEQMATPGSTRFTSETLRLVEGMVHVNALGPIPIKGITKPVETCELTGASTIRRRLQAAVARGLTRFVGRDPEIESLNQALERAAAGHGQVVAAVGEAGVGKSRLMYEFIHSHRTQGWRVLESASVSYGKATPYFPVIDLLKHYGHVEEGDDPRAIRAKVTGQILTLDETLHETIPPLLSLLDALPEDSPFFQLDPPQRRQRTHAALKRVLLRESQVQSLLLVFEDLHWIDSETQALLDSLVESLPTAQLLLLVNYRPEYQHGWGSKTFYTQLRLDPLPPASADVFLEALLGNDPSLDSLKKLLIERTEGNPFFLEESVRTLAETQELVGKAGAYRLAQDLPTIQVPATVQAILAARMDRLVEDDKHLLQTAAVVGMELAQPLLQAVAEMPGEALHRGLAHLQAAEFLYETSLYPEHVYTFKHALTHEVAYGSVLQERRRALHARIVEAIEALDPNLLAEQIECLAQHAFRSEVWEKAVTYLRQAGAKAVAHSSSREALAHFENAMTALSHLPETRQTLERGIDLRLDLRNALHTLAAWKRIEANLCEAERLATKLEDQRRLGWVSAFMCAHHVHTGGAVTDVSACAQRVETIAQSTGDETLQIVAQYYAFYPFHLAGDYYGTEQSCRRLMDAIRSDRANERFGLAMFPAVPCRAYLARALAERGLFEEGNAHGHEAIRIAEAHQHPFSIVWANLGQAYLDSTRGELSKTTRGLERAVALCREWSLTTYLPVTMAALGHAYACSERLEEGTALLEQALALYESEGVGYEQVISVVHLGEAYLLADRVEEACACADRAVTLARGRGERGYEAWACRLLGDVAMHRDPPDIDLAETYYQQALALADELGMRPLQAHCHCGLGTLYGQTDQSEQARAELSTAIEMYRDMEMTFWLPETEAALADLEKR